MAGEKTQIWQLRSESGRSTECLLSESEQGHHELTVLHEGVVAAIEVYDSRTQARARAWSVNRALVAQGWRPDAENEPSARG